MPKLTKKDIEMIASNEELKHWIKLKSIYEEKLNYVNKQVSSLKKKVK